MTATIAGGIRLITDMEESFGWRSTNKPPVRLWYRGHFDNTTPEGLAALLATPSGEVPDLDAILQATHGHFAFVAEGPGWLAAAVDRVRSTPLFWIEHPDVVAVSARPTRLIERIEAPEIDPDGALAVAMAGYTIGTDTLYRDLEQLAPGEALLCGHDGVVKRLCYHVYAPWRVQITEPALLRRRLAEVTLAILERTADQADGRIIAIPLSGGLDSRALVSGLKHVGYRHVVCFAYGPPGNYEAAASRMVAERLGYPWRFHPYTTRSMHAYFQSQLHQAYMDQADCLCSVPFEQDLPAIVALKHDGFIPDDAIIMNGNSGDFISGNHIPEPLRHLRTDITKEERYALVVACLVNKHFRLWDALATPENDDRIGARMEREMRPFAAAASDPESTHGLYEAMEFRDRQCSYVITCQRIYEFLGHEWRLPLWDDDYLDFWQNVPLALKAEQHLYRDTLIAENWCGVWEAPLWPVKRWVSPGWMRWFVRPVCKTMHAPLGRRRWHRFERRFLQYWMELIAAQAVVPYGVVARDRRGARHGVSWHTEAYLRSKHMDFGGRPFSGGLDVADAA